MTMKKKLFTIALALCMVLTMAPGGVSHSEVAWAANGDNVGIYLRTRLVDNQTPADALKDTNVKLSEKQLSALGLKGNGVHNDGYYYIDEHGFWVDYGSFSSKHVASYNQTTQLRDSTGVQNVVEEIAPSTGTAEKTVTKKSGITFDNLHAITWDTLSWSPNSSGGDSWHLNGEVRLCEITFDLNYGDSSTPPSIDKQYAVYNTTLKTGWPETPTRAGYEFDGWYTNQTQGDKITTIPALTTNVTYYAHWKESATGHTHCICGATHQSIGDHMVADEQVFTAWDDVIAKQHYLGDTTKTAANSLPIKAGYYYLTKDVSLGETWKPNPGVVLCLNGHNVYTVSGGNYEIKYGNENITTMAVINRGNTSSTGAEAAVTLTNCKEAGAITNQANISNLKGFYIKNNDKHPTFTMYGGTISGFTNSGIEIDSGVYSYFNMYGGTITGNAATKGGGVHVGFNGNFTLYGGTITRNTATENGGGVHGIFTLGGKATITENHLNAGSESTVNNVYLEQRGVYYINIIDSADSSSRIGVTTAKKLTKEEDEAITIAWIYPWGGTTLTDVSPFLDCFTSDSDSEHIKAIVKNKEIQLKYYAKPPQSSFEYSEKTFEKTYGEGAFKNETLTTSGLQEKPKITYSSNNANVATVDANTGKVTIVGAGTAVITATTSETTTYGPTTASYTVKVARKHITAPTADTKVYEYNGQPQTYTLDNTVDAAYYTISNNTTQTNANEEGYTVKVSLNDKNNTEWVDETEDSKKTADKEYKFKINRQTMDAPAADNSEFTYDGQTKTYTIVPSEKYTVTGNKQTNAGTYIVKVTPGSNYKWTGGSTEAKEYTFKINKAKVSKPTGLTQDSFEYRGSSITPDLTGFDSKTMKITDGGSAQNVGDYILKVSLKDSGNYEWKIEPENEVQFNWHITKANLTIKPKDITIQEGAVLPATIELAYDGLKGGDDKSAVTGIFDASNFKLLLGDENAAELTDSKKAGEYIIRFKAEPTLTSVNYNLSFSDGKLTITKKPASSSAGGYYTPSSAVTTSGSTDSKVTSSPTEVKRETKTDANGSSVTTATVTVSAANQREILRQAKANKSGEIVIKISKNDVKDAAKIALQLEKSFIEAVVTDTDAKLIIQTPDGERTFTQDELKKLAAEATDKTVTVDPAEAEQAQPEQPADTLTPAQEKIVKGVENTNIDLRSQRTPGGNILLTWAKEKGYKVDYFEIYRSTKRSSGYGRKPFFRTPNGNWTKYLNTKNIKEGSTYYYKIRGVRIIDGKKYYTEYSTKAWRSVK